MDKFPDGLPLSLLVKEAAALGATIALVRSGELRPYLNKSGAFRAYGRANVEHWITQGFITPRKDGGHSAAWRIDRIEIEALAIALSLLPYL